MFIELLQGLIRILSALWRWIKNAAGLQDEKKNSEWNNPYGLSQEYCPPHFHGTANYPTVSNLRHRGFPSDVDRSTNQESQSSAVTLPRPFYAPTRQSPNLTKRASNQKPSLVDLLLEQQRDSALLTSNDPSEVSLPPGSWSSNATGVPSPSEAPSEKPTEDEYDGTVSFEDVPLSAPPSAPTSAAYQPPPIAPKLAGAANAGLRGSRPLVKVNRMQFIAQMAREGKEGEKMGDYAPESLLNSVDLSSIKGLVQSNHTSKDSDPSSEAAVETSSGKAPIRRTAPYPTLSLNDLALVSVIGGGGFGQVWKGTWGGTPVAVKLLSNLNLPQSSGPALPEHEQLLAAFEEEVSMLAQLRHPNICLFLGVCLEPPHKAIVTELVSRGSLWDCLRIKNLFQQKSLPWPVGILRRILEGTCRGLIYLHSHNPPIIHRDLKSANLLLDETFNVKICDFGLARLRDYNTVLTANVGTIHWMAPEVLTGNQYNESADMYSVGIVIWELFTGQCPYDGMKQVEVALSVVQRGLRPVIPATCSPAQASIIRRCWDTDPAQRLSAEQLLQEVDTAFPIK